MTLFDLAQELNVSISTISRALSRPEMVAPVTREEVLAAVKQFGFQPNEIARSLRTRQTKTIGIIVPDITNWFFGAIVKAVGEVAKSNGYSVLVCNADEDPAGEEHALNLLRERKASGIINCPVGASLKLWRELKKTGIPVVELDRASGLEKVDVVVLDNEKAAHLAVTLVSRPEKNLFRDRVSHSSARRYSTDVDQVVERKWANHNVGIGRRYCVGIDVIGNLSSPIHKIAVHG